MAAPQPIDRARWAHLERFVARWYRDPLRPTDAVLARFPALGPAALREWFALVGERVERRGGFLSFPDPEVFATWPAVPSAARARLFGPDVGRGLIQVIGCGGHGGWGLHLKAEGDDPPVHGLEDEGGEMTGPFEGPLSALLTAAVIEETVSRLPARDGPEEGPLGPLAPGVRRLPREALGPRVEEHLRSSRFQPVADWPRLDREDAIRADPEQAVLLRHESQPHVLVRTESAWQELQELVARDRAAVEEERAAERRRLEGATAAKLAALGEVPTTGPELLAALEAIQDRLLRFERAFLEDFRRQVRTGSPPPGLLLRAGQILRERGS